MWIIPKQLHTSAFVQDTKELDWDLKALSQECELSLTARGKDMRWQTWLQKWKRDGWIQHLSGRILPHFLVKSFTERWTSSLPDTHVNLSVWPEKNKEKRTPDISGPTLRGQLSLFGQDSASLKTSQDTLPLGLKTSCTTWDDWVTVIRQDSLQRLRSARLIDEKESLSWLTPATVQMDRTPEGMKKRVQYRESIGRHYVEGGLQEQVNNWRSPNGSDGEGGIKTGPKYWNAKNPKIKLRDQVNWPTATARDGKGVHQDGLHGQDSPNTSGNPQGSWTTPKLSDGKSPGKSRDVHLNHQVGGKLNPNWVCTLMGIPIGWTNCDSSETESSQTKPL
jgi:hypothetical protein